MPPQMEIHRGRTQARTTAWTWEGHVTPDGDPSGPRPSTGVPCGLGVGDFPPLGTQQAGAEVPSEGGGGSPPQPEVPLPLGTGATQGGAKASPKKGRKATPKKGKKAPGGPKRKRKRQGSRAQAKGKEAESGQLLCASYNADRLTKASWGDLCVELEAKGILVCAIQDHKLASVAGWDQSTYKMWFEPCYEGPNGGPAGGVGWAVRVGKERCASVAHLPGSGPFVKWITLSVENTGVGKSTFDLASMYVPPPGGHGEEPCGYPR